MRRMLLLVGLLLAVSIGGYFYFKTPTVVPQPPGIETKVLIGEKKDATLEDLIRRVPLQFLELCLSRYERDIESYRVIFVKQEKVQGALKKKPERIRVHFREKPFSVHMDWLEEAFLAAKSVYVEGENDGKVRVLVNLPFVTILKSVDVNGTDAKKTSRYGIDKFGMGFAIKACVESMRAAKKANTLHLSYEGMVKLDKVGNRPCYKFVRKPYTPPEEDGVAEITLYIDAETLLQVGSVLRDVKGELIAEYYFLDIEINPTFGTDQFTDKAL